MKGTQFLSHMSYIDNDLIAEAEQVTKKAAPRRAWIAWGAVAACLCLVAVGAFTFGHRPAVKPAPAPLTQPTKEAAPDKSAVIWADSVTEDEGLTDWNGKEVSFGLAEVLKTAKSGDVLAIAAHFSRDDSFVYQGQTLGAYYQAVGEERDRPDVYAQLLKEGDSLKYGEALYTTGTPDGERWAEEYYRDRVAFYGEEVLSRYIADGAFLKEQLEADLAAAETATAAWDAYEQARAAWLREMAAAIPGTFPTEVEENGNGLILYFTKDQLAAFTPAGDGWMSFSQASRNGEIICEDE